SASVQPTRKAAWSAAAAQALLDHYGEESAAVSTELALLFEAARDPGSAVQYFLLAAEHAVAVCASREAIVLARRAPAMLKTLTDTPTRARQELGLPSAVGVPLVAAR